MKAVLVDAYDSFVYIIYQYLQELGVDTTVVRNDAITPQALLDAAPNFIVLGPGPGHPGDAGYVQIIPKVQGTLPILGICLGHQAIGMAFGGKVKRASHLMHGKTSRIRHDARGVFRSLAPDFNATRYHSLIVEQQDDFAELIVSATSEDDAYIMGLRHRSLPIEGVQFHPESICTDSGARLFTNFVLEHVDSTWVPGLIP
jgi:anthranilate synthase component 2